LPRNKTYMTYTTYTKEFIANFNFADPDWTHLPEDFPSVDTTKLTEIEKTLLSGIKIAYFNGEAGRKELTGKVKRTVVFTVMCLISLMGLIRLITLSQGELAKPVIAATETVNEIIESTMSAIIRK